MVLDAAGLAFRPEDGVGLLVSIFRGCITRPAALAVYASQLGSPRDHARLAYPVLTGVRCGTGYPQGPFEDFRTHLSAHASSSQALPGATSAMLSTTLTTARRI
jgi:hypothetical protein